ncbi:hypothetical protein DTO212C5_668 [Paecilomyces variotii]|nr:hypothetical protein DTO212C5_668 [Paecilomyces variotii]
MAAMASKPEMPTFSYAQAAKGIVSTPTTQQTAKSSANQSKQASNDDSNDSSVPATRSEAQADQVKADTENTESKVERETESAGQQQASAGSSKNIVSGTSSPSLGTASTSTLTKDDDASVTPNGSSDSTWDKQSQASVPVEKANQTAEGTQEKSNGASEKAPSPPKELKAAPIPAVNVWQQRKEAQEAKAKATGTLKPTASAAAKGGAVKSGADQDPSRSGPKKKADGAPEGAGSQVRDRKKTDGRGRDEGARKSGFRYGGAVSAEGALPPVGDAALWPTPQTAQGEEKRKAQEKSEKSEKTEKSPGVRTHGKEKWTPVPYVPTAVFNTPLPSGSRRGGRASRGGRDGGRGGAHGAGAAAGADKAAPGQTVQGSASKVAAAGDRGRNEPNGTRANSLPAQTRRSDSTDAATATEQRRSSQAPERARGEPRAKGSEDTHGANEGAQTNGTEGFPRKSFGKTHEPSHKGADYHSRSIHVPGDSHNGRFSSSHERRFDNGPKSADVASFPREFHSHRDHPRERGDSRPERGRGAYRGRGGHGSYGSSQSSQFPNPHISHHSFIPNKSFNFDRQRSQQGLQNGQSHNRMSIRSPSLPNTAAMYGAYPVPADINTVYAYPPVHPGPMTAIPYQPYMEPFSLMGMISMQLEYYFSVDNLCKDIFLRKHMDSQGFVLLSFIAGFKRVKTLTEDFELLRHVARQLRNVEYQISEDGVDRVRPRERWEQWVLTIDQRDPSAQNEGPPPAKSYPPVDENASHFEYAAAPYVNGSASDGSHHPLTNGTKSKSLSSTAPEFSPSGNLTPVTAQDENATKSEQ